MIKIKLKELAQCKSYIDFLRELSDRGWEAEVIFLNGSSEFMDVRKVATLNDLHDAWEIANVYPDYQG